MEQIIQKILNNPIYGKLITAVIVVLIIFFIIRLIRRWLSGHVKDTNTRYRIRKLVAFVGYLIAGITLAAIFSDRLAGLNIALGVAGAGIAFALQEVIISVAGWFAIVFSNFYKTGDRIELGGIKGDVIDIGILRTTVMELGEWVNGDLYNGRVVRIANSFVFKDPVFNYSGDFPFLWDEITVPIKYGSDYRLVQELLGEAVIEVVGEYTQKAEKAWQEIVKKYMIEHASVEPLVTLTANENWLTFTIRYVVEYKKRRTTKDQLYLKILEKIDESKGKAAIASSSLDINLSSRLRNLAK